MTELSGFWSTGGTKGDQQVSYSQTNWSTAAKIFSACYGYEGVALEVLNALDGTVTGANTVAIAAGGAMVDGKWYRNAASQDVNIPSAVGAGNTRIDRIVLRADWANFNVSVYRIAGTDAASPTAPAITQTSGTTYDIKLYQALVDTAGTVTLTDERIWASHSITYRQGGAADNWTTAGTTNYIPPRNIAQIGCVTWTGAAAASGNTTVTFPVLFTAEPLVFALVAGTDADINVTASPGTTDADLYWKETSGATKTSVTIFWMAIGPI